MLAPEGGLEGLVAAREVVDLSGQSQGQVSGEVEAAVGALAGPC